MCLYHREKVKDKECTIKKLSLLVNKVNNLLRVFFLHKNTFFIYMCLRSFLLAFFIPRKLGKLLFFFMKIYQIIFFLEYNTVFVKYFRNETSWHNFMEKSRKKYDYPFPPFFLNQFVLINFLDFSESPQIIIYTLIFSYENINSKWSILLCKINNEKFKTLNIFVLISRIF